MKLIIIIITIVIAILGLGFFLFQQEAKKPPVKDEDIVSRTGLHWHPHVEIYVLGERQEIPANLGLALGMHDVHTHDSSGTIHLEVGGTVTKDEIKLGRLFQVWGKQFNSSCVLNECTNESGHVKMTVNGQENTEYENYLMQDKDVIEIRYE